MENEPFVIERTYNAPVASVWKALTDNDEMKQWYFKLAAFKPEVGFEFEFTAGDGKMEYVHVCKVTQVIPEKKLAYSWQYKGYEGYSEVTFELFAEGAQTKLKLTHTGLESFPKGNPSFTKESFAKGWTHITGISLKDFVEKTTH